MSVDYLANASDGRLHPLPSIFSDSSRSLSVIIAAYNEQERLTPTLDELVAYLKRRRDRQGPHFTFEIIVVDDGSTDGTATLAGNYSTKVGFDTLRLLRMKRNCGKGCAVKHGMLIARGELCLMMDADGATQIADLESLESTLRRVQQRSEQG